jgi:hypothetical protein
MAVHGGPKVAAPDGLVLSLDAGNKKSYPDSVNYYSTPDTLTSGRTGTTSGGNYTDFTGGGPDGGRFTRWVRDTGLTRSTDWDWGIDYTNTGLSTGQPVIISFYARCPNGTLSNITLNSPDSVIVNGTLDSTWRLFVGTALYGGDYVSTPFVRINRGNSNAYVNGATYDIALLKVQRGNVLVDVTGRGNSGTLTNGPTYSSANGGSIVFDGTNDFMQANVNTTALDGDPSFTVDMFVRRRTGTNIGPNQAPWGFGGTGQGNGVGGWTPTTNLINLDFYDSTRLASTEYYPEGQYVHIVWTKNGAGAETSNVKCYVNGVERVLTKTRNATRTNQFNTSTNGVGVVLGRLNGNATDFHAPVDVSSFKVYTRALTAQEIQQNFSAKRSRFGI